MKRLLPLLGIGLLLVLFTNNKTASQPQGEGTPVINPGDIPPPNVYPEDFYTDKLKHLFESDPYWTNNPVTANNPTTWINLVYAEADKQYLSQLSGNPQPPGYTLGWPAAFMFVFTKWHTSANFSNRDEMIRLYNIYTNQNLH